MESRVDKFSSFDSGSRTSRNARLYKEVYGKYDEYNNLPIEDNIDEIDMNRLKEILNNENKKNTRDVPESYNVIEKRKRNIDEQRVYDINKILEKAKYENHKLRETTPIQKIDTSILSTLEVDDISLKGGDMASHDSKDEVKAKPDLSMTRELKFKGLSDANSNNALLENVMPDNDLSLDLFENLKPTENTITTKPIREDVKIKEVDNTPLTKGDVDLHSGNTSDIDIIKKNNSSDSDFFTSSYEFSKKDFMDDDVQKGSVFKIVLLFLSVVILAGVIAYFVLNYGFGV